MVRASMRSRRQSSWHAKPRCSVAGLVSQSNAILQSLLIIRRNKLDAFNVAAACIVRHLNRMLVLVVTDHIIVVTRNRTRTLLIRRLFIIVIVVIAGPGTSTLSLTFCLQFGCVFSASFVVLLPECFIFHRVQFHVRAKLPFGSVDGIAVASSENAHVIPMASAMILLLLH
jgi:hypothetical protein